MSKIEFNPRKKHHINYIEYRIYELHADIYNMALEIVLGGNKKKYLKIELKTKLHCIKKYSRRLKILKI